MIRSIFLAALLFAAPAFGQEEAQPKLPTQTLTIGKKQVTAEIADDPQKRETGLMFRQKLDPDSGMLFVMPRADKAIFWMKNTLIPLSVAYISPDGVILEIHNMKPKDTTPVPSIFTNIAYALEMDQGWFAQNGIFPTEHIGGLPPPK